jgi:dTDP-4-amino-4,6-dideoxygalactose transaminase
MDIKEVKKLLQASPKGTYQGMVPVDFGGRPVNLEAFRKLADEYGMWLIEDACHAPGAAFTDSKGISQNSGNGVYADLAIFSFHPVKHIASGEGGMITTNNKALYEKLQMYRTHGITRNADRFENSVDFAAGVHTGSKEYPGWYMEMQELGYNYRITDIQAALGLSQLERADAGLKRRREIALAYDHAFRDHPEINSPQLEIRKDPSLSHAYHLYIIKTERRLELYNYLRGKKIFAQVHYVPTHLMPYYKQFGWKEGDMPDSEAYYKQCLSLPMYPSMSDEEQQYVIDTIHEFFRT